MKHGKLFFGFLIPPIFCLLSIIVTQSVFWLTYNTNTSIRDYIYQTIFFTVRSLSLFNIVFIFICLPLALASVVLGIKNRFSKKEMLIATILNAIIPFIVIFVIVGVNGGV